MPLLVNTVQETANAPGRGDLLLQGAVLGFLSFRSAVVDQTTVYAFITDGLQREWGEFTFHAGNPDRLTRDRVISTSAGTAQPMNFQGAVQVYSELPAERAIFATGDNRSVPFGARVITGVGRAVAPDHAPRLDQVAWRLLSDQVAGSNQPTVISVLDPVCTRFRLEWNTLHGAAVGQVYARFSFDGGATYQSGAADYGYAFSIVQRAGFGSDTGADALIRLSSKADTADSLGFAEFASTAQKNGIVMVQGQDTSGFSYLFSGGFSCGVSFGTATHILLGHENAALAFGRVRLLGAP